MIRLFTTLCLVVLCFAKSFPALGQIDQHAPEAVQRDQLVQAVKEALKKEKNKTPTQDAENYYQFETSDKPCNHCPQYLNLIREVNKIVEKVPVKSSDSISLQNESLIQLNRLKFMYYERKITLENGGEACMQYQQDNPINPTLYNDDNTIILAEEALSLPNITSLQLIPEGNEKEIRYFYKGTGSQTNVIIEIVIYPDRRAVLRYRRMKGTENLLPDLGSSANTKPNLEVPAALVNLGSILTSDKKKIGETLVQQDIKIAEDSSTLTIGEGLKMTSDTKAKLNKQSVGVALNDGTKDLVKIDVQHKTLKNLEVSTVVPAAFKITDDGLTVGGAVSYDAKKDFSGDLSQTKSIVVGLTDHNHEYITTSLISRDDVREIALSSKYNLGTMGSVSGTALQDSNGRKEFKLSHGIKDNTSSMTTSVGMSADARRFFELQREQKIGKSQSMVLTIRTDDKHDTTIMYQYRLSLK